MNMNVDTFKVVDRSSYGKVELCLFLVVDFIEPIRLDEWKVNLNSILTEKGFKKEGNKYITESVRIKDIAPDYLFLPSDESEEEFDGVYTEDYDEGILYVKRMKIYAVPEKSGKGSLSEVVSKLADIVEGFMGFINYNPKKTFFGVRIVFQEASKASEFKENIQKKLAKLEVGYIYQSDDLVDVIVPSIAKATDAFKAVEEELYGGYLFKIKSIIKMEKK